MATNDTRVDPLGRTHAALRLSVTGHCNLRCRYCMPADGLPWIANHAVMTDDEAVRLVELGAGLDVRPVRVTGGEPLLRPPGTPISSAVSAQRNAVTARKRCQAPFPQGGTGLGNGDAALGARVL